MNARPILRTPDIGWLVALTVVGMLVSSITEARPNIRDAFFSAYSNALGTILDTAPSNADHCGVCHFSFEGGGPRNPYGRAIEAALPGFPNNPNGKRQAVLSVGALDSDGDGVSNEDEVTDVVTYVNTPTFPGLTFANVDSATDVSLSDITAFLEPTTVVDVDPPVVNVTAPIGGEGWAAGSAYNVTWTATDDVGVTGVDIYWRDADTEPWKPIARNLANSGTFMWFVPNMPTTAASVRVDARDAVGHVGTDMSDAHFQVIQSPGGIVATTLRDFEMPGTQPLQGGTFGDHTACTSCHGGYDIDVEPGHGFEGMMMAQAARDPLFFACLAIAEQDAPSSGDLCLRCHTPTGWLAGRSQPTDGSQLIAVDRDGVNCEFCHRAVDPIYKPGISPPEDQDVLNGMLAAHVPSTYANGQFVVDTETRRRGPYDDPVTPHAWLESPFHRSGDMCGTCHDVSNPVFERVAGADYVPGPLDQAADSIASHLLFPLERTYSEWKNSSFPAGVFAPGFAGEKPDGIVASCQDCHMADVTGEGCNDPSAPERSDLGFHDFTGGSVWMPALIAQLFPSETNSAALTAAQVRADTMLKRAAQLDLQLNTVADSFEVVVTVTNQTGHKLPTGYPEGRRMWLNVVARDESQNIVFESGAYDTSTGVLTHDVDAVIYETKMGISPALAAAVGAPSGESFHFTLNDSVYKDNRIPPLGFTNAAFEAFGGAPVDDTHPVPRYVDGQNWDTSTFGLPPTARSVWVTLYYQSTSKEYVEFLKNENVTNNAGDVMYDLWVANGRAAPITMARDSMMFSPVGVPAPEAGGTALRVARNPFRGALGMQLSLPAPRAVRMEIFDPLGRRVAEREYGLLGAGVHELTWNGRSEAGGDVGSGVFWARVTIGREVLHRQVVRIR